MNGTSRYLRSKKHYLTNTYNKKTDFMKHTLLPTMLLSLGMLIPNIGNAEPNAGDISKDAFTLPEQPRVFDQPLDLTPVAPEIFAEDEDAVKVLINEIQFVGNTVLSTESLSAVLSDELGQSFSFVGLENLAKIVTREYQFQGYLITQAYLPAQDLKDGLLIIQINEGYVDQISVDAQGRLKTAVSERYLAPLQTPVLNSKLLERKIRLLSDIAGNDVEVILSPSQVEGKTDLALRSYDTKQFTGYIAADNAGNRFTTAERLSGNVNFNNSLGYGERIGLSLASSGEGYNYANLDFALPIGGDGLLFTSQYSYTHYRLQEDFESLDADGNTDQISLGLSFPLLRSLDDNIYTSATINHQDLQDKSGLFNTNKERTIDSLTVAAYGDHLSTFGDRFNWRVALTGGSVNLDSDAKAVDLHKIDGSFSKINASFDYDRFLNEHWSVFFKSEGQISQDNLDSNMKLSLGGADLVRAYPQGEASVDDGILATLELRYQYSPELQLTGFYDLGSGTEFNNPLSTDTNRNKDLAGGGLKASWNANNWFVKGSVAWRTTDQSESDSRDSNPRAWIQVVRFF